MDSSGSHGFIGQTLAPMSRLQTLLAASLCLVALFVWSAALLAPQQMSQAWPAVGAMSLLTALAMGIAGLALLLPQDSAWHRQVYTGLTTAVVVAGLLGLAVSIAGMNLAELWAESLGPRAVTDRIALWPGQVALPAAAGLLCAGCALWLVPRADSTLAVWLSQALIVAVVASGCFGIVSCLTGLASIYRFSPDQVMMRWPAGAGLVILGVTLGLAAARNQSIRAYYARREDRQIFVLASGTLLTVLVCAWSVGAGMLAREWVANVEKAMLAAAQTEARLLDNDILHHHIEAEELIKLGQLRALAQERRANPAAATRLAQSMAGILEASRHAGIVGLRADFGDLAQSIQVGAFASQNSVLAALERPRNATLVLGDTLRLRSTFPIDRRAERGAITVEARLDIFQRQPAESVMGRALPARWLCPMAEPKQCFRLDLDSAGTALDLAAYERVRSGSRSRSEVQPISVANEKLIVAMVPLGGSPLHLALQVEAADFLVPLRTQLAWALLALLALAIGGVVMIHQRASAVVHRLVLARTELATLLDHAPDAIVLTDANRTILSANRSAQHVFAAAPGALVGANLLDHLPRYNPRAGTHAAALDPARTCDGRVFLAEVTSAELKIGTNTRFLFILRDVSDREQLRRETRSWLHGVESAGLGIALTSVDGELIELCNPAFARLHGYAPEELSGKPLRALVSRDSQEAFTCSTAAQSPPSPSFAATLRRRDGTEFQGLVSSTLVRDETGRPIHRAIAVQDITEIKATEEALARSEALLREVLDVLPVGVWITDPRGVVVRVNAASRQIWGGPRDLGSLGLEHLRAWWPDSGERVEGDRWALARTIRRGEAVLGEILNIEAFDGTFKTITHSALPLRGEGDTIEGAIVVFEDITAKMRAADDLRLSKELFQSVIASAAVGMALCDPEGNPLLVNSALCGLLGYSEAELLDTTLTALTHEEDLATTLDLKARALRGEFSSYQIEKRYVHKNGETVWSLLAVALVRDSSQAPKYFIAQLVDISARKSAENQLRASEARLARAQQMARLGDWDWDLATGLMHWSRQARNIIGFIDPAQNLGALIERLTTDASDRALLQTALNRTLTAGASLAVDLRVQPAGKDVQVMHLQGESIMGSDGRPARIVGTIQDVTERICIEQALRHSEEQLRALSAHLETAREEERKRIALEVHDELGQLLTTLRMHVSLLRLGAGKRKTVTAQIDEMRMLVDRTLEVARHLVANLRPAALNFGLVAALEWLAEDFSSHAGLPCAFENQRTEIILPDVAATTLFRIAQEALTNVRRHSGARSVRLRLETPEDSLSLEVHDDGKGFVLEHALSGASFGLVGMRERILLLGGSLRIDTAPGQGTIVRATCPISSLCPSVS